MTTFDVECVDPGRSRCGEQSPSRRRRYVGQFVPSQKTLVFIFGPNGRGAIKSVTTKSIAGGLLVEAGTASSRVVSAKITKKGST